MNIEEVVILCTNLRPEPFLALEKGHLTVFTLSFWENLNRKDFVTLGYDEIVTASEGFRQMSFE